MLSVIVFASHRLANGGASALALDETATG
jgi:hypothetical protein